MWQNYSSGYRKNNRSSGRSVMIAAFLSALLLSLLCGLFYNMWKYEIERIELEEGGWQGRIEASLREEEIALIRSFPNVKDVAAEEKETAGAEAAEAGIAEVETSIDIYFNDMRNVFKDMPRIAESLGIPPEQVSYHYALLAMYLIRGENDTAPRLLFPMFILIMTLASFSLIIIIHNAFAVSMNAQIHQFGIFASIGATPKQIRTCLLQEAAAVCALPVFAGNLLGIGISMGLIQFTNVWLGNSVAGRHKAVFHYHPLVLALTLTITVITIWISAWMPAGKLSRLTPLEAIKNTGELQLKRKKNSPILTFFFGIEGKLAGNALRAQKRALRMASLSLICAFMAFTMMQCFFTLSGISTRETYFERYQDIWDIMVTLKDSDIVSFAETKEIQGLDGIESAIVYQKAAAKRIVTEAEMSDAMKALGGFSHALESDVMQREEGFLVNVPLVILDDASFLAYCGQLGIEPRLDGVIIRNQIRDVTDPDFRHPQYMPYIKEESTTSVLRQTGKDDEAVELAVLSYAEEVPPLREEYATLDYYELVHFLPVSLWKEIKEQIAGSEETMYICICGRKSATVEELDILQGKIEDIVSGKYLLESENRIRKYETNAKQIAGMMAIFGSFCILLALIGIGDVFSNTLGFVRQRKREFARYLSVGMTPGELRKMFCIEALVITGRPVLITLPLVVAVVWYMLKRSYLEIDVFLAEAPFIPVAAFMAAIVGSVALAYYLGWRGVRKISLPEVLRDDTML
ncbi:MAG: ABC transporter permease [Blautia sp.]|nr:ABC transporter permease [Lachnoclostridium sp.]MCM1211310.1 ABC transporter permease [Blautia sp.]